MASTAKYNCKCCGSLFEARTADRERGWAKFCSKSCKAIKQTQKANRSRGGRRRSSLPTPDGVTPMRFKKCCLCGEPAVNGYRAENMTRPEPYLDTDFEERSADGIDWYCRKHLDEVDDTHPFSSDALGQW